jgi:tetratricopeptide (TPR) repeat protein
MKIAHIVFFLLSSASLCPGAEEWERLADQAEKHLYEERDLNKAIDAYSKAIALQPTNPALYANRGNAFSYQKNLDKAITDYDTAIKIAVERLGSDKAKELCYFYYNKAYAYDSADLHAEAIPYYERVISIDNTYPDAHGHLAWILSTTYEPSLRNPKRAVELATHELNRLGGKDPDVMDTLAAAYAASRNFSEAVSWQQKALNIVKSESGKVEFSERLRLYQNNSPYFQTNARPTSTAPAAKEQNIGSAAIAATTFPASFRVEQESTNTVFVMPRKNDSDGPISMRLSCLKDLKKEELTTSAHEELLKKLNKTDKVLKAGDNVYSTSTAEEAAPDGTKWVYGHYAIIADDLLVTATIQTIAGREMEPQCKELMDSVPSILKGIRRNKG